MNKLSLTRNTVLTVLAFLLLLTAARSSFVTVQYGTVAVLTRFGKITGEPLKSGLHFKIPFVDRVVTYRTQKVVYETLSVQPYSNASNADYQDVAVDTNTKDGQRVSIRYTVRFSIDPDKIEEIAGNLGTEQEVVEKVVKTDSRIWVRQIPRSYSAEELYTGSLDVVSQGIAEKLAPIFEENGLIMDEFGIRAIEFSDEYVQAIEQKQIEKERVNTEKFKAEQEEHKKQAAITKAQGEAEAQRLQQNSLTKELLQKMYIEKWNGILPEVVTDANSSLILDLNK